MFAKIIPTISSSSSRCLYGSPQWIICFYLTLSSMLLHYIYESSHWSSSFPPDTHLHLPHPSFTLFLTFLMHCPFLWLGWISGDQYLIWKPFRIHTSVWMIPLKSYSHAWLLLWFWDLGQICSWSINRKCSVLSCNFNKTVVWFYCNFLALNQI